MNLGPRCLFNTGKDQWATRQTDLAQRTARKTSKTPNHAGCSAACSTHFPRTKPIAKAKDWAARFRAWPIWQRLRVEDVAIPKAEIVALSAESGLVEIVQEFRSSGYSRIPVYEDTLDKPLGLLLLKDLALRYGFNGHHDLDLAALLRPILYVPPSMPLSVLLRKNAGGSHAYGTGDRRIWRGGRAGHDRRPAGAGRRRNRR